MDARRCAAPEFFNSAIRVCAIIYRTHARGTKDGGTATGYGFEHIFSVNY